jgi:hypothetical protein
MPSLYTGSLESYAKWAMRYSSGSLSGSTPLLDFEHVTHYPAFEWPLDPAQSTFDLFFDAQPVDGAWTHLSDHGDTLHYNYPAIVGSIVCNPAPPALPPPPPPPPFPPFYSFTGVLGKDTGGPVYVMWPYIFSITFSGCEDIQSWVYNGPSNGSDTTSPDRNCAPGTVNCYYARSPDDEAHCATANAAFCTQSLKALEDFACNYQGTQSTYRGDRCGCPSDPNAKCEEHGCYNAVHAAQGTESMWCGGTPGNENAQGSLPFCVAEPYTEIHSLAGESALPAGAPPFDPYAAKQGGMQILGPGAQLNASFISRELARQAERASRRLSRGG